MNNNNQQRFSRRRFLGAVGGLVAVSALPARADNPDAFVKRGKFERLVLGYAHIDAGATRPFSLLHISDTHLTEAYDGESAEKRKLKQIRTETFGGRQEEALRDSLDWAKRNVDFVLHTGDLIDWQSDANFDLVRKYYGSVMVGALGNHEYSPSMWLGPKETCDEAQKALSAAKLAEVYPFDISFQSKVVNGVNFITIDDVYGTVSPIQVDKFKQEAKKGLPIILCKHVPFFTPEIWRANAKFWKADSKFSSAAIPDASGDYLRQTTDPVTKNFISYLKSEKLLKGILAGHLHINVQDRFSPTAMQYVVAGNFMFHGQEILFT